MRSPKFVQKKKQQHNVYGNHTKHRVSTTLSEAEVVSRLNEKLFFQNRLSVLDSGSTKCIEHSYITHSLI